MKRNDTVDLRHILKSAYLLPIVLSIYILPSSATTINSRECKRDASTELEIAYCAVLEKSRGRGFLPNFNEFRRNNENTQRLILTGPARKFGIILPAREPAENIQNTTEKKDVVKTPREIIEQNQEVILEKKTTANIHKAEDDKNKETETKHPIEKIKPLPLNGCQLNREAIRCTKYSYFLAINVPKRRLPLDRLASGNSLVLRTKHANESTLQYLSDTYPYYIEKMLYIGLGDSTLSFTKYRIIYEESIKQNRDFARRFSKMYELLKVERKTMDVKPRYKNNYPETVSQCVELNADTIACDNAAQNWVYRKLIAQPAD